MKFVLVGIPPDRSGRGVAPDHRCFGVWGQRWAQHEIRPAEIDPEVLAWVMHRWLGLRELPADRAVLLFEFPDVEIKPRRFRFVIDHGRVDVCLKNPGRPQPIRGSRRS